MCSGTKIISKLLIILWFATPLSAQAESKPVIQWFHADFPPVFIIKGPLKGQGYGDKVFAYFMARMPEFEHIVSVTSIRRAFSNIRQQDGICEPALFKTPEREKFMHFSKPLYYLLSNQMVTLKSRFPTFKRYINHDGAIDLEQLLTRTDLNIGIVAERLYSTRINAALAAHDATLKKVHMPHHRFARLLSRGRIDYTFGFPAEATFQFKLNQNPTDYITVPVKGETNIVAGHIACSDMPLGHEVIKAVNRIASEAGPTPSYWQFYEDWLDENAKKNLHQARLKLPLQE